MDDVIKVSDGARKLREYLSERKWTTPDGEERIGISIPRFCDEALAAHGLKLDRIAIKRVLDGDRGQRVTVDFALAIEAATGGVVRVPLWASDTLRPIAENAARTGTES